MEKWLYLLWEVFGEPFPRVSIGAMAVIGALLFGGGWWLLGRQYHKDHPGAQTTIDLDNKVVKRIGDRRPPNEAFGLTNASTPIIIDAQPLVIQWQKPEHRRIAVYKSERSYFPEQEYSSGQKFPQLTPGRYYFKITPPDDEYTPLHLEVVTPRYVEEENKHE